MYVCILWVVFRSFIQLRAEDKAVCDAWIDAINQLRKEMTGIGDEMVDTHPDLKGVYSVLCTASLLSFCVPQTH